MASSSPSRQWGIAWVALALAVALHVADEALSGFLPFYNGVVEALRESAPWVPLPTFTFPVWLAGLSVGVTLLLALSPLAFDGRRGLRPVAYFLGILMVANALGHMAASVYLRQLAPGVLSSPILFAAAVMLLHRTAKAGAKAPDDADR